MAVYQPLHLPFMFIHTAHNRRDDENKSIQFLRYSYDDTIYIQIRRKTAAVVHEKHKFPPHHKKEKQLSVSTIREQQVFRFYMKEFYVSEIKCDLLLNSAQSYVEVEKLLEAFMRNFFNRNKCSLIRFQFPVD